MAGHSPNHQLATEYAAGYRDKSNVYRDGLLQQLVGMLLAARPTQCWSVRQIGA